MASICFYFQVHQPYRIKKYRIFDVGHDHEYFNDKSDRDTNNEKILHKVAKKCYLPTNKLLLELLEKFPSSRLRSRFQAFFSTSLKSFRLRRSCRFKN